MRSLRKRFAILWALAATVCFAQAPLVPASKPDPAPALPAREELLDLRQEVTAQRREIEILKATVEKLEKDTSPEVADEGTPPEPPALVSNSSVQKQADPPPPLTSGWNGEHFFLKSPDGLFQVQPVGYLNANYTFYKGDGAPPDTFAVKRARFGVQGNYGAQVDYVFLFDAAASNGISIRDAYLDFKPFSFLKFQAGQFKEPFSQEVSTGDTNVEFFGKVDRLGPLSFGCRSLSRTGNRRARRPRRRGRAVLGGSFQRQGNHRQ
jgi:hypothetical protein